MLRFIAVLVSRHFPVVVSQIFMLFLLQRLTRSLPGTQQDDVLTAYISHYLLGCRGNGDPHPMLVLMQSREQDTREQIARLFNTFSSLADGRSYLSEAPPITNALLEVRGGDTATRRNALGAIQKLSLRYRPPKHVTCVLSASFPDFPLPRRKKPCEREAWERGYRNL